MGGIRCWVNGGIRLVKTQLVGEVRYSACTASRCGDAL